MTSSPVAQIFEDPRARRLSKAKGSLAAPAAGKGVDPVAMADHLAMRLARARHRITLALAQAAGRFIGDKEWFSFGYARLEDHVRERFGRSGRWVRDLRCLSDAITAFPALSRAITGEDGGRAIGPVAALVVGRVATTETCEAWIALARRLTVRELREAIQRAKESGMDPPHPSASIEPTSNDRDEGAADSEEHLTARHVVPPVVRAIIEEARDLHRAVCGGETHMAEFVEALMAEASAGSDAALVDESRGPTRPSLRAREKACEEQTDRWSLLRDVSLGREDLGAARETLEEVERLCDASEAGTGSADAAIRSLVGLENRIDRSLGDLLARMGECGAWMGLRFSGVGHYAEERLGVSRSQGQSRARMARLLRDRPSLRAALEEGRFGWEAASLVVRAVPRPWLRRDSDPSEDAPDPETAWIDRATECTVKRLRDELRVVDCERGLRPGIAEVFPLDDRVWHESRSRRPGQTIARIEELARAACVFPSPTAVIQITLAVDLMSDLRSVLESERQRLEVLCRDSNRREGAASEAPEWEELRRSSTPCAVRAAQMFSNQLGGVPQWVAWLSLVEGFVRVWDDPRQSPRRAADRIYIRDAWRCSAPGCTSRRNLEEHHVLYRSRGGGEDASNRVTLCRFHHQQGGAWRSHEMPRTGAFGHLVAHGAERNGR